MNLCVKKEEKYQKKLEKKCLNPIQCPEEYSRKWHKNVKSVNQHELVSL